MAKANQSTWIGRCLKLIDDITETASIGRSTEYRAVLSGQVWQLMQEGFQRRFHRSGSPQDPEKEAWNKFADKAYLNPMSSGLRRRADQSVDFLIAGQQLTNNETVLLREMLHRCSRLGTKVHQWKRDHPTQLEGVMRFRAPYEGGETQQQTDNQEAREEDMHLKAQAVRTIKGWVGQVHKYDNSGYQGDSLIVWQGEPVDEDNVPSEEKKTTQEIAVDEAEAKINEVVAKLFQS